MIYWYSIVKHNRMHASKNSGKKYIYYVKLILLIINRSNDH